MRCLFFLFFFTYFTQNIFISALFDPQCMMIPPAQFLTKSICPRHLEIPIFSKRVPLRHKKRSEELPTSLSCCLESAVRRSGASARTFPNTAPERERVQGKLSGPDFHKVQISSLTNRDNQEQSNLTICLFFDAIPPFKKSNLARMMGSTPVVRVIVSVNVGAGTWNTF